MKNKTLVSQFNLNHLVNPSPWPILGSLSALNFFILVVLLSKQGLQMYLVILAILLVCWMWWSDTSNESNLQGWHLGQTLTGIQMGMITFIISEILLFSSFFWGYFHFSLAPSEELGAKWPPMGTVPFNPLEVPLLNTILLLSSGVTVTLAHHCALLAETLNVKIWLGVSVTLGVIFSLFQICEYNLAAWTFSDGSFGSIFFIATSFHGLHVIVGSLFLTVSLAFSDSISTESHTALELSIWYWHFVDLVWLFLYSVFYWWSV